MSPEQLAALFSPELNLSPEARALVAHVASIGGGEVPYARLGRLLHIHDERKLRRAVSEAEDSGWVAVERQTGRGHSPRFTFTPAENTHVKADSPAENAEVKAPSSTTTYLPTNQPSREAVVEKPADPPPPRPAPVPSTPEELQPVRAYLGEFAYAADLFATGRGGSWPAAVLGKYGPHGTRREFWRGIQPEREPAIVADALLNYASDFPGKPYQAPLFESLLARARDGAPVKPPKIVPGTEHAAVRSSYGSESPGETRALHRMGAAVPERVLVNIRKAAAEKVGPEAAPAELEREVEQRAAAWEKHHGNGARLSA